MGRAIVLLACMIACVGASGAQARGINPTKWSSSQWRSDLFDSYPLRPRYHRVRVVKHVVHLKIDAPAALPAQVTTAPQPPRVIRNGRPLERMRSHDVIGPRASSGCTGVLIITWDGQRAQRDCR